MVFSTNVYTAIYRNIYWRYSKEEPAMARPYFWLVFSFICCCLVGSISAENTDLKEYLLNKSFVAAIKNKTLIRLSAATDLIEFDPSNQKYYYNLAQAYMFKEDFENAAKTYQKAQGRLIST